MESAAFGSSSSWVLRFCSYRNLQLLGLLLHGFYVSAATASSPGANSSKCLLAAKLSSSVYIVIAIFFKLFPDRFGS
uniref:Uncharacterized protein n=1 Tax=Solanum tuberosum TaxID=4113 RepID=M1DKK2_SOLTU